MVVACVGRSDPNTQRSSNNTTRQLAVEVCMIREFPWVPWESHGNEKHRLNSWEWERELEWWTGNRRKMGIVVWKKFPLVAIIVLIAEQFAISS